MLSVVSPPPVIQRHLPSLPKVDGDNLQAEAERLSREVREASTRNAEAAKSTISVVRQVKTFEERTRDTLRSLMEKMGEDNEGKNK